MAGHHEFGDTIRGTGEGVDRDAIAAVGKCAGGYAHGSWCALKSHDRGAAGDLDRGDGNTP